MARVAWKEGNVVSIETREGVFVLAQMLESPFLAIFNIFKETNEWCDIDLNKIPLLFYTSVTRQFLKLSNITKQPNVIAHTNLSLPSCRLRFPVGSRKVTVWEGTEYEKTLICLAATNKPDLIDNSCSKEPVIVKRSISIDDEVLEKYEITAVRLYPELNERLYLCYKLGRNIDPVKEINLGRELPLECRKYVDIISGVVRLDELGY